MGAQDCAKFLNDCYDKTLKTIEKIRLSFATRNVNQNPVDAFDNIQLRFNKTSGNPVVAIDASIWIVRALKKNKAVDAAFMEPPVPVQSIAVEVGCRYCRHPHLKQQQQHCQLQ